MKSKNSYTLNFIKFINGMPFALVALVMFIITINLIYFHHFDSIWISKKSFLAMIFAISFQLLIFLIAFIVTKSNSKLRLYLTGFILVFIQSLILNSAFGKYNWGEIPNIFLLKSTLFQDIELYKKVFILLNPHIIFSLGLNVLLIIYLSIYLRTISFTRSVLQQAIISCLFVCFICYLIIFERNKSDFFYKRYLFIDDPMIGFFIDSKKYSGNRSFDDRLNGFSRSNNLRFCADQNVRNVIFIVCDGMRPDHMSVNGYQKKTTPFLDTLVLDSSRIRVSKLSTSSCTASYCGITSLLYGVNFEKLPLNKLGIHDVLKQQGFKTHFILSGAHKSFYGLGDLYGPNIDTYFESTDLSSLSEKLSIYDDFNLVTCLKDMKIKSSDRHFFYFHIMAPHLGSIKSTRNYRTEIDNSDSKLIFEYDNGVLNADFILGELIVQLKQKRIYDNSLIIITADHGEGLKENSLFNISGHINLPIDELLNVPLIIIDPSGVKYNLDFTTQVDIFPTVLDRLTENFSDYQYLFAGKSLVSSNEILRTTYHYQIFGKNKLTSLAIIESNKLGKRIKYLYDPQKKVDYLFDLTNNNKDSIFFNDDKQIIKFRNLKDNYFR